MKRSTFLLTAMAAAAAPFGMISTARADEMDDLKKRFRERYNALQAAKSAGSVGETAYGYVELVKNDVDRKIKDLVNDENSDRRRLYALIAKDTGASPEVVASRNAARNFERARSGEYLKGKDGRWYRKK